MSEAKTWTPEEAREYARQGGLASGETRRRRATMTPRERAQEAINAKGERLVKELLDAALGEGDFDRLDPRSRATALLRCNEYLLGKPSSASQPMLPAEPEAPADTDGFTLQVIARPEIEGQ